MLLTEPSTGLIPLQGDTSGLPSPEPPGAESLLQFSVGGRGLTSRPRSPGYVGKPGLATEERWVGIPLQRCRGPFPHCSLEGQQQ